MMVKQNKIKIPIEIMCVGVKGLSYEQKTKEREKAS